MAKKTYEFETIDHRTVSLVPIDETATKAREVSMQFCKRTTKEEGADDVLSGWWKAKIEIVFDGQEVTIAADAKTAKNALEKAVKNVPGAATMDDYEDPNADDTLTDFFSQKLDLPAEPMVKWDTEIDGHKLTDLRSDMEEILVNIEDSEDNALEGSIALGRALVSVNAAMGGDMKKMEAFVRGEGLGDGAGNMPHLTRLGAGANAIKEAMRFGQAHDNLLDVLSYKTTSGKGLERLKAQVQNDFVKAAARAYLSVCRKQEVEPLPVSVKVGEKSVSSFDASAAGRFLRCVLYAKDGFNIDNALEVPFDELGDAADARASAFTVEFMNAGGKRFNSYNDVEFVQIKKAFGYNLMAWEGSALPGAHTIRSSMAAVKALADLEGAPVPDQEAIDAGLARLIGKRLNPLFAAGVNEVTKMLAENEEAERQRQQLEDAEEHEEDDEGLKKVVEKFRELDVQDAINKVYSMVRKHPKYLEVANGVADLCKMKAESEETEEA